MKILKMLAVVTAFSTTFVFPALAENAPDYVYYDQAQIEAIQEKINKRDPHYLSALEEVESKAKKLLPLPIESVISKPTPALSGDPHDYLSLAPYFWPDPTTESGLPWIRKDGEINPLTRGENTDQVRASNFLKALGTLFVAYTYTENKQYADKMKALINTWMVDPATRMNPNLNYAQGIPGVNNGRPFGIIEWEKISHVVSALQVLMHHEQIDKNFIAKADAWLSDYLNWLITSELGVMESTRLNNHGSWYDYQVVGLLLYLGESERAKEHLNITKNRVAQQIQADGSQPHELKRTKSVHYASMNLSALVHLAYLGQKLNIDLWNYKGKEGQSLEKAVSYFYPYLRGEKPWQYKQIGSIEGAFKKKTYPMLNLTQALVPQYAMPRDIASKALGKISSADILLLNIHLEGD